MGKKNGKLKIDIKCIWELKKKDSSIINPLQVQLAKVYSSKCYELWSEGCMNRRKKEL